MLKEIMLASALTLSTPPLPHFYDINNVYYRFDLNFLEFDYQHYNAYVIDLNSGTSEIGNIYSYSNHTYQLTNTTSWHDTYMKDFQHYLSYVYDNRNTEESFNINDFYLEWDLNGSIENANTTADEIVIDCFFAVPGSNEFTLIDVSGVQKLKLSVDYNYSYLYAYDWLNAEAFLNSDNAFLILRTDGIQGSEEEDADFETATYYTKYSTELHIGDSNNYIPGSYSDFIYENISSWVDYGEDLNYEYNQLFREANELLESNEDLLLENAELTNQNEKLDRINQELRQENEELNSKHALSSVFEIVRGAFDGIINFLEIELMPNLTIGTIIFIPVVIGVIFFILKALVL